MFMSAVIIFFLTFMHYQLSLDYITYIYTWLIVVGFFQLQSTSCAEFQSLE